MALGYAERLLGWGAVWPQRRETGGQSQGRCGRYRGRAAAPTITPRRGVEGGGCESADTDNDQAREVTSKTWPETPAEEGHISLKGRAELGTRQGPTPSAGRGHRPVALPVLRASWRQSPKVQTGTRANRDRVHHVSHEEPRRDVGMWLALVLCHWISFACLNVGLTC